MANSKLFPPLNFGCVEDNLYRSAIPTELNLPFLATLHLTTIICLDKSQLSDSFNSFIEEHCIHCIAFDHVQSEGGLYESVIRDSLQLLLNRDNYPVLVMCKLGKYINGVVVGCLRKYQKWAFVSIFEEYRRFGGSRFQLQHEQFIELFDTDLITSEETSIPLFLAPPPPK